MYSPGRFELLTGLLLMIPGVITALLLEDIPLRVLVDPSIVAFGLIGAIWNVELFPVGVSLLYFLYFVGVVALLVTLVNRVRDNWPMN